MRRSVPLTYGGRTFLVNGHGGAGGYAFSVDTGVMGANWWFKEPGTRDPWGARVSSRALPLATKGIETIKAEHDQFLMDLGMTFSEIDRRLSRIDYAIDHLLPDFIVNPAQFVTHSNRAKKIQTNVSLITRGNRYQGITIGKMPGAQICVYDKRREILDKKKFFWWDMWRDKAEKVGIVLSNKSLVWRFEFRAGKNFLEKIYRRKTWEAFAANPSLVFEKIAAQTRLTIPQPDTNRARWPSAPVWKECQERLAKIELEHVPTVNTKAIKQALYAEYLGTIGKQTVGLIISQMAAYELGVEDLSAMLKQVGLDIETALEAQSVSADRYLQNRAACASVKYGR